MNTIVPNPDRDRSPAPKRRTHLLLKIAAWVAGSAVALILLLVSAIAILLHNQRFHDYLLRTAQEQATDSFGVRVQLQNFDFTLSNLTLNLYGLTVDGAAPYSNLPLLQVDHVEAGIRIISILQRKWYLDSFQVDRPIARVLVDAHGVSNIPTLKSSGGNNNTSLFDLGIRHALLVRGEVYYNNHESALAADFHNVDFEASFNSPLQRYSGRLAYSDGHLVSGSFNPIPHDLEAEFDATPTTFHLTHGKLSAGPSQLFLTATLQNYSSPVVDANYEAVIDGGQISQILQSPSRASGQVRAVGSIRYLQTANRPPLDCLELNGDLNSRRLIVKTPSIQTEITNVAAHYALANGGATLKDLKLGLLGGELTATGTMSDIGGNSHSSLNADLRGVSLADLKRLARPSPSARAVSLSGALSAKLAATWGKSFGDLVAHFDSTINGGFQGSKVGPPSGGKLDNATPSSVAINGAIHGAYSASNKQMALNDSYLQMPQTSLKMNGVVGGHSSLAIRLQADDLHELETVANMFLTAPAGQVPAPLNLAGIASFQGTVRGTASAPHLSGQFVASNLEVRGNKWKVLRSNVDASPSLVSLQHADLEPASGGRIAFNTSIGLAQWSFSNASPFQLQLDAAQLKVEDLAKLAGQQAPVSGTLAANVNLHGTELNPIGDGSLSLTRVVAYDQPVTSAKLTFSGSGVEVHAALAVQSPAGVLQSNVSIRPKERTYTAQLTSTGIRLEQLQALSAHNINVKGTVLLKASGEGSFGNPRLDATAQIAQLLIQGQTVTGLNVQINVADHVANATLATSALNTKIDSKVKVNLTGDYVAEVSLDTQAIPLQPLLAAFAPEQSANISGQVELHATLHGPLKDTNLLEAHVTVPTLKMAYGSTVQVAAVDPIHLDYKNGVVELQRTTIRGTDTDLQLQGSVPVTGSATGGPPMSANILGTVNLQLAQLFDPEVRASGELKININSHGASNGSDVGGQIDIVDASFASGDLPVELQHGNGFLTVTRDRITIGKFQGTVGGGTVTAQGGATLQPIARFDVALSAQGIRVLYPQGMREGVDANIRLAGSTDSSVLSGSVNLSDISFTPAFDLNEFLSQFGGGVSSPPTPGFSQNLQLNLAVRSTNNINLVSRALSVNGSANLQVRGTAASPVILGRVNLNNGDIILNGDRFLLNGGTVEFVNPSETEPVVNVTLQTTIQQYDIYLRFNGPVDQLRTNYNSNPALPSADIINLLAFGQTTEASAVNSANTSTNQQAESLVASQVSSQVTSRVSKIAGISQLSISPVLTSGTSAGPPGANITIQQRVTGNLFVTFSSNVASTQNQTIQGQYQLSPRVALSVTRDQNGGFAFDTLIKKTW